jgi:membrane-associated protease RseP (regulator of RpoE activity)
LAEEDLNSFKPFKIKISVAGIISLATLYFLNGKDFVFMIICALMHEAGHFIAMFLSGVKPIEITVGFLNFNIKYNKTKTSYKKDLIISLGGVGVSFVLAFVGFFMGNFDLFYTNMILFVINMLPIPSLDGENILLSIRGCKEEKEEKGYRKLYKKLCVASVIIAFSFISSFNLSVVFSQVASLACGEIAGD